MVDGIVSAMSNGVSRLRNQASRMASSMVDALRGSRSQFYSAGYYMADGLEDGFINQMPSIRRRIVSQVKSVANSVKNAMKISSPSKVFAEIGNFMAQGLGVGFVNEMKSVNRDIQRSLPSTAANHLLGGLQGTMGGTSLGSTTSNKTMNFTQNIYAPQQPSRIELYRQTKNLLSLAERGI